MQPLVSALPVMSVSTIFCLWNFYRQSLYANRRRQLCARVAYMLWVASDYARTEQ